MHDLQIWHRLKSATAGPADLLALAAWPLSRRAPYLDRIAALAGAADPAMVAAALRALAGARGAVGVRAIVEALGHGDDGVRAAALDALRATAREAPCRFAHALFHERADVRRAALDGDLPRPIAEIAAHLCADPDPAIAARAPLAAAPLALAFDLHAAGHLADAGLVERMLATPSARLREFLEGERGREPDAVDAYLDEATREARPPAAPGRDVLDQVVAALDASGGARALDHFVETVTSRRRRLARRAAAALLSRLVARGLSPGMVGVAAAFEPRVIRSAMFDRALAGAAAAGMVRFRWPVRPTPAQVDRLVALPLVRGGDGQGPDLALAAALAGLWPGKRLERLAAAVGEAAITDALAADDRGWDEICRLPPARPAVEQSWLATIERASPRRYVELAARALGLFAGERLDTLVDQMPRQHRAAAFLALAALVSSGAVDAGDAQLAAVCRAMGARLDRAGVSTILLRLLDDGAAAPTRLVLDLSRSVSGKLLAAAARQLDDDTAVRLIAAIDAHEGLPWDRELALAAALADRAEPRAREWAARVVRASEARPAAALPLVRARRALNQAERDLIASCPEAALERALEPAMAAPVTGLALALEARAAAPSVAACAALIGCVDPLEDVARQLDRFAAAAPRFDAALDDAAISWQSTEELPILAHARLYRWEAHRQAVARWIDACGGAGAALALADSLPGRAAARSLWRAVSAALVTFRYRDRPRFARDATAELAELAAGRIDSDVGPHAAAVLVALVEGRALPAAAVRDRVLDRAADADAETRALLSRLVRLDGMPEPPPLLIAPAADLLAAVRASDDIDELAAWCADTRWRVVEEAVLRLVLIGEAGQERLAALIRRLGELPSPAPLLASIPLWDSPAAKRAVRELAAAAELPPELQYRLCLGLAAHGDLDQVPRALEAARAAPPTTTAASWFRRSDWPALVRVAGPLTCSLALVDSPHFHAYQPAVTLLLNEVPGDDIAAALRRFLDVDSERPLALRRQVAVHLARHQDDRDGLPILVGLMADAEDAELAGFLAGPAPAALSDALAALTGAALVGGEPACTEKRLLTALRAVRTGRKAPTALLDELHARVLEEASTGTARREAAAQAVNALHVHRRMSRVAEVFAWGVRRGLELTGRLLRVHMTGQEREFGHTRIDTSRVFVSPLPLLRGEPFGQDVVEGLILHELGHHVYHGGEEAMALWKQAQEEGIGPLLNLVADEHLERNLRAVDPAYGDRLKRLDAYAFQHAAHEIGLAVLLDCLRAHTAPALIAAELEVAFDEAAVRVRRGAVLAELDRIGHPLARFTRALRMGLGNRHGDPLTAQALALCGRELRRLDMRGLYDLTRKLADMFGGAAAIAQVFGGPEGLVWGERDGDVYGAGIGDDAVQREVERILDPEAVQRSDAPPDAGGKLRLNVSEETRFDPITRVERVRGDELAHRRIAAQVARHAARLRALLDDLGMRWEPTRARIQGRMLDRTRLRHLVTRGDPRILIARQPVRRNDLFLGTLIDCSSSMSSAGNIERARRFAVLIAEAVRPLAGVEARFFGFNDTVIFDAGDAADCSVAALTADGGNNDAAALLHAAGVASESRRRARVLVMISDGLPTKCSVAALRGMVGQLTRRRGILCAQVAVRPLEEVCFPDYVVLDDDELEVATARFGRMVGKLARRALSS
ncbi:MAG TPA: vWA domain-containing protein [Kofleriaceae bacterium]|nr:vWA domain-containing protein [Kofleriaceae bacterium]